MDEFSKNINYKKCSSKTIFLIVIFASFAFALYMVTNNKVEEHIEQIKNYKYSDLVGNYIFYEPRNKENTVRLYLREDGSFRYNQDIEGTTPYVGTYKVENGKLYLTTKLTYGSDYCYYKQKELFKDFTFDIVNKSTLKGEGPLWYGKEIALKRDTTLEESEQDRYFYILNPKDGASPQGRKHSWIFCDTTFKPEYEKIENEFIGNYISKDGKSKLYLRDNGEFRYTIDNNKDMVGKFTISDEKIELKTLTSYSSNRCFQEDSTKYNLIINPDKSLSLYKEVFKKDNNLKEEGYDSYYYISDPVNNALPKGSTVYWRSCYITEEEKQSYEGYENVGNTKTSVILNNISFPLNSTFDFTRLDNVKDIKSALSINGNILDNKKYKLEFAFQYGNYNKYTNYEYDSKNDYYYLPKEEYIKVYKKVYDEDITLSEDEEKYKSYTKETYMNDDIYRFDELSTDYKKGYYKTVAKIYNSINDCNDDLKLIDSKFCRNNAKELGKIEVEYKKDGKDNIIKSISLYKKGE